MPGTRKLGRPTAHRNAMLRGMVTYLLENGQIETTLTRAKEVRALTEKMITVGKKNTLDARRAAMAFITKEDVVKKLFDQIAPGYADRDGGYTRIYKMGPRRGDGAEMAIIKLVADEASANEEPKKAAKASAPKKEKAPKAKKAEEKAAEAVTEAAEETAEKAEEAVAEAVEAAAEEAAEVSETVEKAAEAVAEAEKENA
ncbi:MAG: 50S ribosomal protein L17 [Clostridia bacterium]|nr:50S ribosomal protein L17 [Clostridia bacterium]